MFVSQASYDYHLTAGSPCVDVGTTPGMGAGYALAPTEDYVQPTSTEGRTIVNVIDIGAYELGGAVHGTGGGSAATSSSSGGGSATTGSFATAASSSSASGAGVGGATGSGTGGSGAGTGGATPSSSGGGPGAKSGCSCDVAGETAGAPAVLLGALAWLAKRSRRRRGGR
jgi:MYXO-CTERM domain-containing protein